MSYKYKKSSGRGGFTGKIVKNDIISNDLKTEFPGGMIFYCKNRKQIININPKTFDFKADLDEYAKKTESENIEYNLVYGSERSIKQYFKISDNKFDMERKEREIKENKADKYG